MPLCKAIFSDKIIKRIYSAFFSYWLVFRSLLFLFLHKKNGGPRGMCPTMVPQV